MRRLAIRSGSGYESVTTPEPYAASSGLATVRTVATAQARRSALLKLFRCMVFQGEEDRYGGGKHYRGEGLPHGHESVEVSDLRVRSAEEFREYPENRIPSEERRRDGSRIRFPLRNEPKQREEDGSFERRFEEGGREVADFVYGHGERSGIRRVPEEFPVDVVRDASEHDADGQYERDFVRRSEKGFFHLLRIRPHGGDYADDASVEAHSAFPSLGDFERVGEVI